MIEFWRAMANKGNKVGAIVMDLSKAFETLHHKLLLCKLKAYGYIKTPKFYPKLLYKYTSANKTGR